MAQNLLTSTGETCHTYDMTEVTGDSELLDGQIDPRTAIADWANRGDEWVRFIVRSVLSSGRSVPSQVIDDAYLLYRQEKGLDERTIAVEPPLEVELGVVQREAGLTLKRISSVAGVNALSPGAEIEFNVGLTLLYGENGTGKTGYARILKALANSRTADTILPNIHVAQPEAASASVEYDLGGVAGSLPWAGEIGKAPFTRMSVFDSPAVNFHVDEDLEYVYTPATLALFTHVSVAIQGLQSRLETEQRSLTSNGNLLQRFKRGSSIYPKIEVLGATTDVADLQALAESAPDAEEKRKQLVPGHRRRAGVRGRSRRPR